MQVSVLVVEEQPNFRHRFAQAVSAHPALTLVGATDTVAEACARIAADPPDVVLVGLLLADGNGVDVIRHVKAAQPAIDVIVVTRFGDDGHVVESLRAGATGYLLQTASDDEIAEAILQVRAGGAPISPMIARRVIQLFLSASPASPAADLPERSTAISPGTAPVLSQREIEVLQLVAKGLNFKEVAAVLAISQSTVVTHVKRIYQKLAVHSRGEAVYEARQLGLL